MTDDTPAQANLKPDSCTLCGEHPPEEDHTPAQASDERARHLTMSDLDCGWNRCIANNPFAYGDESAGICAPHARIRELEEAAQAIVDWWEQLSDGLDALGPSLRPLAIALRDLLAKEADRVHECPGCHSRWHSADALRGHMLSATDIACLTATLAKEDDREQ